MWPDIKQEVVEAPTSSSLPAYVGSGRGSGGGAGGLGGGGFRGVRLHGYEEEYPPLPVARGARGARGRGARCARGAWGGRPHPYAEPRRARRGRDRDRGASVTGGGAAADSSVPVTVLTFGDGHAKRLAHGPPAPPSGGVSVSWHHGYDGVTPATGGGTVFPLGETNRDNVRTILNHIIIRRLLSPLPNPEFIVVSTGGNALTSRETPHAVSPDHASLTAAVANNLRWLLDCLGLFAGPEVVVVLISAVPRARLSDADLAAFRALTDAQRAVAAAYSPRCVLLDVERLLQAEESASGSWRRRASHRGVPDAAVKVEIGVDDADVWSVEPLPVNFPRLRPTDFNASGVNLHPIHYRLVRAAVEEEVLIRTPVPAPSPPACHRWR